MGLDESRFQEGEKVAINKETGGEKAVKSIRFDLIPPYPLWELARVYGEAAANKYGDRNWERGYPWAWSIAALFRHLYLWLAGERLDPQYKWHHLAQVMWHCCALMVFEMAYPMYDDRTKLPQTAWMQVKGIASILAFDDDDTPDALAERWKEMQDG